MDEKGKKQETPPKLHKAEDLGDDLKTKYEALQNEHKKLQGDYAEAIKTNQDLFLRAVQNTETPAKRAEETPKNETSFADILFNRQ